LPAGDVHASLAVPKCGHVKNCSSLYGRRLQPANGALRIHVGCELSFDFPQTMPMIATLNVHFSRFSDLERPDHLVTKPSVPVKAIVTVLETGAAPRCTSGPFHPRH